MPRYASVLRSTPSRQISAMGGARAVFIVYPDDGLAIISLTIWWDPIRRDLCRKWLGFMGW